MSRRIDLSSGQVWLGKSGRKLARRIVAAVGPCVIYSDGGDGVRMCLRTSFLRWRGRPYDERHGKKGGLV